MVSALDSSPPYILGFSSDRPKSCSCTCSPLPLLRKIASLSCMECYAEYFQENYALLFCCARDSVISTLLYRMPVFQIAKHWRIPIPDRSIARVYLLPLQWMSANDRWHPVSLLRRRTELHNKLTHRFLQLTSVCFRRTVISQIHGSSSPVPGTIHHHRYSTTLTRPLQHLFFARMHADIPSISDSISFSYLPASPS